MLGAVKLYLFEPSYDSKACAPLHKCVSVLDGILESSQPHETVSIGEASSRYCGVEVLQVRPRTQAASGTYPALTGTVIETPQPGEMHIVEQRLGGRSIATRDSITGTDRDAWPLRFTV